MPVAGTLTGSVHDGLWPVADERTQQVNATEWAKQIGRRNQTVMDWVHKYNEQGPAGQPHQWTGGRSPFLGQSQKGETIDIICDNYLVSELSWKRCKKLLRKANPEK